ncbi:hypothetical protein HPB48_006623 [Haemaphysalis longicornis]|uniref:Uncharacterized protein n=1 Tax=Haemaphysalis longicornis TaxID=44386 RepID=A0A9J6GMN6_HAELO|nr:hypothetical protein HPB48_006623 [Haemaphysalis longicornis]
MAPPEHSVLPNDVPLPEDMDLQSPDNLTASFPPLTSTKNPAAAAMPSRVLLQPDANPFAPLRELEEQNGTEGKPDNASHQVSIISTSPNGQKRARGSLLSTPVRQYSYMHRDYPHASSTPHMPPGSVHRQEEEDGCIPVSYRRKQQNRAMVATSPSPGAPRKYQHTVILRLKQPCRIMDEHFIRLDRIITHQISAHLNLSGEDSLPKFLVRYLGHSNQLAVRRGGSRGARRPSRDSVSANQRKGRALSSVRAYHIRSAWGHLPFVFFRTVREWLAVCDICHKIGHYKERCPNTLAARCPQCGLRQHEEATQCPGTEPKCRSCGGSHSATATNCPTRRQLNQKIEQKLKPAAERQRRKTQTQGRQRRNPDAGQGLSRPMIKATRQSFYTGPTVPPAAHSEDSERITFADVAKQANARLTIGSSNGAPRPSCSTQAPSAPQPAPGGGTKLSGRNSAHSTALPPPGDHPHPPATTTLQDLERRLENRMAEIEKLLHAKVDQLITRAIEKCVHTIMQRITLSGMLPFGKTPPTTVGAHVMRTPWAPSSSIAPYATTPHHG